MSLQHPHLDAIIDSYLKALAFIEAPECHQVPGEFDVSRFHFSRHTRAAAVRIVGAFLETCERAGFTLSELLAEPSDLGHALAFLTCQLEADLQDLYPAMNAQRVSELEVMAREIECPYAEFRRRDGRIHMMLR